MALAIAISAYHPEKVFDWFLENALVIAFLALLAFTYRKFPLSQLSYLLIFAYLGFHEWGAHFKYSDVPLGEWMKPLLHTHRNMYDRVVHFSFGLLLSYPMEEVFARGMRVTSSLRYYLPVEMTLAFSALYEILEAGMAMILSPERGAEFVGMQGDIWDSQKDMLVAGIGSVCAVILIAVIRRRRAARAVKRELAAYASGGLN